MLVSLIIQKRLFVNRGANLVKNCGFSYSVITDPAIATEHYTAIRRLYTDYSFGVNL